MYSTQQKRFHRIIKKLDAQDEGVTCGQIVKSS